MHDVAYEVTDLVKRYPGQDRPANDGLSLTVYRGEVFGLLGPNGAGKTTLVRQMSGLSRPTSGTIRLFGHDLAAEPRIAAEWVALQPQGVGLPRAETPRTLLWVTARLRGLSPQDAEAEVEGLLQEFMLTPCADRRFYSLSGGQQRLVSICLALTGRRPVLVFDEPTNDLDPEIRRVVWRRIRRAANEGAAVVLVTHNVIEAEQALDRVAIIRTGKVLSSGTPVELKAGVSDRVRLELLFRADGEEAAMARLSAGFDLRPLGPHRYGVVLGREQADESMRFVLSNMQSLLDFRIVTPNLEDVYVKLSGGEPLAG